MRFPYAAPWYRIGMAQVSVSFRVDFSPDCAVGPGKIALLEHISSTGSLSEAARKLKMSYRRAWLLLEDLNTSFQQPVADECRWPGGRGGLADAVRVGPGCRLPRAGSPDSQARADGISTNSVTCCECCPDP
jgi:molybdate transport repressor ModE-like protein